MTSELITYRPSNFVKSRVSRIPDRHEDFYGKGLSFPPEINNSVWETAKKEFKIKQSIFIIITTPLGTRFRRPDFGSMIPLLVFSVVNDFLRSELLTHSETALKRWEPRIEVGNVYLDESEIDDNRIGIVIPYTIKGVGVLDSISIPFNLNNPTEFVNSYSFSVNGEPVFARQS